MDAQSNLAICYQQGMTGEEPDMAQAVTFYAKAAAQGKSDAQFNLGLCYEMGVGVSADEDEALAWYHKAAQQGHDEAESKLQELLNV